MNKLEASIKMKCPKCKEGDVFQSKNPFEFGKMTETNTNCPKCGIKFEKEIGFFYGSMYVSYAFNVAIFVVAVVAYYLFFEATVDWRIYISGYLLLSLILYPVLFRLSRSIWLQLFY